MSWFDAKALRAGITAIVAAATLSACQVRPLYGEAGARSGGDSRLAAVAVEEVATRDAQQVRNHLIFLINGGQAETAEPRWRVNLGISSATTGALARQVSTTEDAAPTAATVTMTTLYVIADAGTGETVASGKRQVASSFDRPGQSFASARAQRDAEDRAARELAEQLRLAILQDLARVGP